jgi:hypothetical protein
MHFRLSRIESPQWRLRGYRAGSMLEALVLRLNRSAR